MKEIKFRAWDKYLKRMIFNFDTEEIYFSSPNGNLTIGTYDSNEDYYELEIMQFTGLKENHNGKEIWEGDIITNRDGTWEIKYVEEFASFQMVNGREIQDINMCNRTNKVIGNIYESPGLIKENPELKK